VLPALGVVLGASCCLSVAGLVALAVPSASQLSSLLWVYYVTFFLFPLVAAVLLWLNLRSIQSITATLQSRTDG
jgi:membrane protein implicated in regulation of membrane protease activity